LVEDINDTFYGAREFGIRDPTATPCTSFSLKHSSTLDPTGSGINQRLDDTLELALGMPLFLSCNRKSRSQAPLHGTSDRPNLPDGRAQ